MYVCVRVWLLLSDRLSAMETRVDSLAALVQCAIMRPTDSVDSLASDSSQTTAVHSQCYVYLYKTTIYLFIYLIYPPQKTCF